MFIKKQKSSLRLFFVPACLLIFLFIPENILCEEVSEESETHSEENAFQKNWLDRIHDYVEDGVQGSAVWFDNFFGTERSEEESPPETFIRWKGDFVLREGEDFKFKRRFHFDFKLPKLENRFRLILTSEREDDLTEIKPPDIVDADYDSRDLKLRFNAIDLFKKNFHIDVAWLNIKGRFRYTHPLTEKSNARFTQTLFLDEDDGLGETTRFDLEYLMNSTKFVRWSTSGTYSEESSGLDWGSAVVYYQQLSSRNAISFRVGTSGETDPESVITNYNVGFQFRRSFYRRWIFYEIEPEYNWPRHENGSHVPQWKITFRLEVQFGIENS
ncbi:MAG: hypothetical protein JW928_08855 [Candidatus Aureabacteria bacterium]|nr:hypothetical protein [Candidatus Auribacterota bacterium]